MVKSCIQLIIEAVLNTRTPDEESNFFNFFKFIFISLCAFKRIFMTLSKNQHQPENWQPCMKIKLFIALLEVRKTVLSFISNKTLLI